MAIIHVLDDITVDKIAAGEVVERPSSIVKELVENSIDAKASIITVEIKDGGTSLIRVTDNGTGIEKGQIAKVFLRHATSKIETSEDLETVRSLGFRGEALSSISAVCQVELITKSPEAFVGIRVNCNGGKMEKPEEIGAPDGTTIVARNIFFNTPVRRKFLKSNVTEAGYVTDLMQRIALSRPDISFKFISNGQTKFYTSGSNHVAEVIYRLYGREISENMLPIEAEAEGIRISGFLGKPVLNRASRNFETFFINERYIKSSLLSLALEQGYRQYIMQHKYPMAVLYFDIDTKKIDVNVHPTKMEVRITEPELVGSFFTEAVEKALAHKDFIPQIVQEEKKEPIKEINARERQLTKDIPEPFETKRATRVLEAAVYSATEKKEDASAEHSDIPKNEIFNHTVETDSENLSETAKTYSETISKTVSENTSENTSGSGEKTVSLETSPAAAYKEQPSVSCSEQLKLFDSSFFSEEAKEEYVILGQIFKTYWIVTLGDRLYIIDQHAAHEKVMYEAFIKRLKENTVESQMLNPPIVVTLTEKEQAILTSYEEQFAAMGFEIEEFGGNEFALRAVPSNLYGYGEKELFLQTIDELLEFPVKGDNLLILQKIASMSCKAAVKGGQELSFQEAKALIDTLFTLENPYHCPHGRPTVISMSKYEIEKKFKRIVS